MLKRVTFIGNPNDPRDASAHANLFGHIFYLGRERDVELTAAQVAKLDGNSHFTVEDSPLAESLEARTAATNTSSRATTDAMFGSPAELADSDISPAPAPDLPPPNEDGGGRVTVSRERPRNRSK